MKKKKKSRSVKKKKKKKEKEKDINPNTQCKPQLNQKSLLIPPGTTPPVSVSMTRLTLSTVGRGGIGRFEPCLALEAVDDRSERKGA